MKQEQENGDCKICKVPERQGTHFCERCNDGPFCRYCLVLRHKRICQKSKVSSWFRGFWKFKTCDCVSVKWSPVTLYRGGRG